MFLNKVFDCSLISLSSYTFGHRQAIYKSLGVMKVRDNNTDQKHSNIHNNENTTSWWRESRGERVHSSNGLLNKFLLGWALAKCWTTSSRSSFSARSLWQSINLLELQLSIFNYISLLQALRAKYTHSIEVDEWCFEQTYIVYLFDTSRILYLYVC